MKILSRTFYRLNSFADKAAEDRHFAWKLFFLALILRILFTLIHTKFYLYGDMLGYNEAAVSLLQDHQFRVKGVISASRPPIYPYFLLTVYYFFGQNLLIARLMQAVTGAITSVIVFKTGEVMFNRRTGVMAGWLYAGYTASWALGDMLLSENLFTLLMLISVYFMIKIAAASSPMGNYFSSSGGGGDFSPPAAVMLENPPAISPWIIFWAGIFAGLAALTRTSFTPFIPFVLISIVILKFKSPKIVSRFALMTLIFLLTVLPWMLRNYYTHGVFTMNPKSGSDFYLYNHSGLKYIINNYEDTSLIIEQEGWKWSEVEKGRRGSQLAVEWIKSHPLLFIAKGCRMMMNIWGFDRDYLWWYIAGIYGRDPVWLLALLAGLTNIAYIIIAPLAIAGFFISKPLKDNLLIPTLVIACLHFVSFAVYGFSRHRFPFVALIIVWAAYAILNWKTVSETLKLKKPSWRKSGIIFGWIFLLFSWSFEILLDAGSLIGMKFVFPGF